MEPKFNWTFDEESLELVSSKSKQMKLNSNQKKMLDADTQTLVKNEILNSELNLTSKGQSMLLSRYLNENKAEIAKEVAAQAAEEKAEAKTADED